MQSPPTSSQCSQDSLPPPIGPEKTEFKYAELSPKAQERARNNYCVKGYPWDGWWEFVYEDMVRVCELFCIETDEQQLSFSGFWSQGDGASFSGRYEFRDLVTDNVKAHAPGDEELHALAERLDQWNVLRRVAGALLDEDDDLGRIGIYKQGSRYCHSHTMYLTDVGNLDVEQEEQLLAIFRDLADWHYDQLQAEYEHLISDEEVARILSEDDTLYDEDGDTI